MADFTLQIPYAVTTGTANVYAIPTPIASLVTGMAVTVKINVASTGASTLNWDAKGAKGIKKADGTNMTNLKLNGVYTLRYDGVNFILQGEGGEYGTATQPDVKASKTLGTPEGIVQGTMPENGATGGTITTQGGTVNIPSGHTTGGVVDANISNLIAGNIKDNVNVGGVVGTFSELANGATAAQILATRSAAVNGAIVNGAMVDRAGDTSALAIATSVNTLRLRPSAGFRDGINDWVTRLENNWIPANIPEGLSMFGKAGTLALGKKSATGTASTNLSLTYIEVRGLTFQPTIVIIENLTFLGRAVYWNVGYADLSGRIYTTSSNSYLGDFTVYADGFRQNANNNSHNYRWIAIG